MLRGLSTLYQRSDHPMTTETITVKGMSCAHCEARVNNALSALPGVKDSKASAKKSSVTVRFDETAVTLDAIRNAVTEAGYTAE